MSAHENKAEIIRLPVGIPGVGRAGDRIASNPEHQNPKRRLVRFGYLDPSLLPFILDRLDRHRPDPDQ